MKKYIPLFAIVLLTACGQQADNKETTQIKTEIEQEKTVPIIDSTNLVLAVVTKEDGKKYFIDTNEVGILGPYEDAKIFSSGIAPIKSNGKWGMVDVSGKTIIPFKYEALREHSEGKIAFRKNGLWGFMNMEEEIVIEPKYNNVGSFQEGMAWVVIEKEVGASYARQKIQKYGFIDESGKEVIQCIYDDAGNFSEGLAFVKEENIGSFIDNKNQKKITQVDGQFFTFSNGFKNGVADIHFWQMKVCIDSKAKTVVCPKKTNQKFGRYPQKESDKALGGYNLNKNDDPEVKKGLTGYADENGNWIIEPKYKWASPFGYTFKEI